MMTNSIRDYLFHYSKNWRLLKAAPGAWMMSEFLARIGVSGEGQALPKGYRKMTPQLCFYNTAQLVRRRKGLRYCEGYVWRTEFPITILHAWALDADNRVIDPTLREPELYEYIGYPMSLDDRKRWLSKYSQSVFDTGRGVNIEMMIEILPELTELIDRPSSFVA
jgi:hypothetical protein